MNEPPNMNDDFFDLGGNSLIATLIVTHINSSFGKTLSLREFFFSPNITALSELLAQTDLPSPATSREEKTKTPLPATAPRNLPGLALEKLRRRMERWRGVRFATDDSPSPWGLPTEIFLQIRTFVSRWDGMRVNPGSLVVGRNTAGKRPPLFWVFQGEREFLQLSSHLGEDQPLYGMRSGHLVMDYTEDNIQALALSYVNEIENLHPAGPMIIGGNCQGGVIALAIAQHLLRRQRHIPLLILMEWAFGVQAYTGPVALVFGSESEFANPWLHFQYPELAWRRAFRNYRVEVTPGKHGKFFNESNVPSLATIVNDCIDEAIDQAPERLPKEAKRIKVELIDPPRNLVSGTSVMISARVSNLSPVHWNGGDLSGLMLASHWKRENDDILQMKGGHTPFPPLSPGASCLLNLSVTTPLQSGMFQLIVQAIEEGVGLFDPDDGTARCQVLLDEPMPVEQKHTQD